MTTYDPPLATVSLNGSEPIPCEVDACTVNGLKEMTLTAHAAPMEFLGVVVDLCLRVGDHAAEGRGLVTSVRFGDDLGGSRTTIRVAGPMREVPA